MREMCEFDVHVIPSQAIIIIITMTHYNNNNNNI